MKDRIKFSNKIILIALIAVIASIGLMNHAVYAACTLPPAGIVSWWPGEGNAKDIVISSGNNGTLQGGTTFATGMVGQAFSFDGVNDYVNIGNKVKPPLPLTVSTWVKFNNTTNLWGPIFKNDHWSATSNPYYYGITINIESGGQIQSQVGDGGYAAPNSRRSKLTDQSLIPAGVWKHIAVVFKSHTNHQIYVDGIEYSGTYSGSGSSMVYSSSYNGAIGYFADYYTDGLIDEVSVYNRALTDAEIYDIYAAGSAGKCKCAGYAPSIIGTTGNDTLTGTNGTDIILGLDGDDIIDALGGTDAVCAGPGNDAVYGGDGNDYLFGEAGNDMLYGEIGQDTLNGGPGDDVLDGGLDNSCNGGTGTDTAVNCIDIINVP